MAQIRARWRVRMLIEAAGQPPREHDVIVDACSSDHAIKLARNDFYGRWATPADRERLPLRVLELLQVDV